jgi:hypothetical protein
MSEVEFLDSILSEILVCSGLLSGILFVLSVILGVFLFYLVSKFLRFW